MSVRSLELRVSQLTEAVQTKEEQLNFLRSEIEGQRKELERVHEEKKTLTLDLERKSQLLLVQRGHLTSTTQKLRLTERRLEREPPEEETAKRAGVGKQLELMNKKIGNMHKVTEREKEISKLQLMRRVEENSLLISELNDMRYLLAEKDAEISDLKFKLNQQILLNTGSAPVIEKPPKTPEPRKPRPPTPPSVPLERRKFQELHLQLEAAHDHVAALSMENSVLKDQISKLLSHVNFLTRKVTP